MVKDIIIIGGGIVGLSTALYIKQSAPSLSVLIIEKENRIAKHQTGNNSGVIHSGLYYKPGSLKATNCIRGYHQMIAFCNQHSIPYDLCGKIVVATDRLELPLMNNLLERGKQNGLEGLKVLNKDELEAYEPHVTGVAGIFVPQTGIVDYIKVAEKFATLIQELGGEIKFNTKVTDISTYKSINNIVTDKGSFQSKLVINCAGLYSDKIASYTQDKLDIKIIPFRGEYYQLTPEKEYLVKNLIYPVPNPNFPFLGVHFTRMARGGVEAGPNAVLAFQREGYKKSDIHFGELAETIAWSGFQKVAIKYWKTGLGEIYRSFSKRAFTKALQKLIPEIREDDLVAGGAGVRAQACHRNGSLIDDFLIIEDHNVINVCNAPSPAATSSLSIGENIGNMALMKL